MRLTGVSARGANRILGRTCRLFWQDESYDHCVRNERELWRIVAYIESNPVMTKLVEEAEGWRWSSLSHKDICFTELAKPKNTGRSACATKD